MADDPNTIHVGEIVNLPQSVGYAVSGIPIIRDGKAVTLDQITAQGWDTSPFRATWHTVLAVKDNRAYVIPWQSHSTNLLTSGEAAKAFAGYKDVIKLDGGGSFMYCCGDKKQYTAENRVICSILRLPDDVTPPKEPEQPAPDPDYEKWKSYMARWEAEKAALPVSDWAEELLAEAVAMGITNGTRPQAPATRQEVALMVRAGNV